MTTSNAIAIIGMSCRFPDANNVEEFWKNLIDGKDSVTSIPPERWYMSGDDDLVAGYLKCPLDEFDSNFFNISPKEAPYIDPQQRLFLEVGWESIENARIPPTSLLGTKTGVWLGIDSDEYFRSQLDAQEDTLYKVMGNTFSAAPGRLSYFLNLCGPSVAVAATCASSAVAVHLACNSLLRGDCTLALAGGVNTLLETSTSYPSSLLSTRCKAFDSSANGFAPAEGCGVLVLKLLDRALADGDNILATICGSAINHTGKSSSFGTPNSETQEGVVRDALKAAGVSPSQITFYETHGTGTAVGDPTEITGIKNVYSEQKRSQPLILGSVKTNIGHALSAAGVTGLIKMILCMKYRRIPKHLHLKELNPNIPALDSIPAIIPMETMAWEADGNGELYGAVSCFGITGSNVHFILKEGSLPLTNSFDENEANNIPTHLVTISANDEVALETLCHDYKEFLNQGQPFSLADFAYSVNTTRTQQPFRLAATASSFSELISKISSQDYVKGIVHAHNKREPITFLFTGHGCQYFGMAKTFYETNAVFRSAFDQCSALFRNNFDISLQEFIWEDENSDMTKTKFSQPAIYCIQYCLFQLWVSLGVRPDVVLGHSIGEFAACVAAGLLSFEDGMRLVVGRSHLTDTLTSSTRMMAVGSTEAHVRELVSQFEAAYPQYWVDIATVNSTHQTVISTTLECLEPFTEFLKVKCPSVKTKVLVSEHGFHSRAMDPILDEFEAIAAKIEVSEPKCTYVSGTVSKFLSKSDVTATYWRNHLRNTVSFSNSADLVLGAGNRIFVEIGPQPVLLNFILANYTGEKSIITCPSIRSGKECWSTLLTSLAKLHVSGGVENINFEAICKAQKVTLPNYTFNRKKCWANATKAVTGVSFGSNTKVAHPLLGCKLNLPQSNKETRYYTHQSISATKYIKDHVIADNVVVPAAAYLEMSLAIGRELGDHQVLIAEDLTVSRALYLDNKPIQVHTLVTDTGSDLNVAIFSDRNGGDWIQHASSVVRFSAEVVSPTNFNLAEALAACPVEADIEVLYRKLAARGLAMGSQFQSLHRLWHSTNKAQMLTEVLNLDAEDNQGHICHPILLDAMVQTFWQYKMIDSPENAFALPVGIGRFTWYGSGALTDRLYIHVTENGSLGLYTDTGLMLARMENVTLVDSTRASFLRSISLSQQLPQFMKRDLVKYTTPTVSRIVLSEIPALSDSTIAQNLEITSKYTAETKDIEEHYSKWCYMYILKALTELGWVPKVGETYSKDILARLVTRDPHFDFRVFDRFGMILEEEGILNSDWTVIAQPPTAAEIQKYISKFGSDGEDSTIEYNYIKSLGEALPGVLQGSLDPIQIIFNKQGADVSRMYSESRRCKYDQTILCNSFESILKGKEAILSKGLLRILEVGGGTGGATSHLLPILEELGIPYQYTFTDVGPSFIPEAKKRFEAYSKKMLFDVLDIEKDPKAEGFVPHSYDIVIASHVVHVAGDLGAALGNIRHLLADSGFLFLVELTQAYRDFALSFDLLESFWKVSDSRAYPIIDSAAWLNSLGQNGFAGSVDTVPLADARRTVIVARASDIPHQYTADKKVWVLFTSDTDVVHGGLEHKLKLAGKQVFQVRQGQRFEKLNTQFSVNPKRYSDFQQLSHVLKNSEIEGVVFEWGLTESHESIRSCEELKKSTECNVAGFLNVIKLISSKTWNPRVYLVTAGVNELNPNGSGLWGLLDTYLNEFPDNLAAGIDLDLKSSPTVLANQVFSVLWGPITERAIFFKQGNSYNVRIHNMDSEIPLPEIAFPKSAKKFKLVEATDFTISDILANAEIEDVEVCVEAVGLNFRDILLGSGMLEGQDPGSVGLEFAGTVSRVNNSGSSKFQVGDRVAGLSDKGSVASHISVPNSDLLFHIPKDMSFVEAATLPVAYGTCYLSLIDVAKIQRNERILIHTGSGGVGLSGIQLARMLGAEIFVTAGTNKKRNYLRKVLGLTNVYDSRNTDYSDQILADTNGNGVNVVINTLTGVGFKEATLKCLGKGGRFIELSKLNVWSVTEVAVLRSDVQYTILDAFQMIATGCPRMATAVAELGKLFESKRLKALPQTTFPLTQIRTAFQFFQKSQHIGKIVLEMPESLENPTLKLFKPEGCYLVTGGLGGLGLQVVKFVAERGGHVVVVGRKPPTEDTLKKLKPISDKVTIMQGDVGDYAQCESIIRNLQRPLKGILHCAGVFSNGFIMNQSIESFAKVYQPKIYGSWNLHELTKTLDLDFFVMFSSIASLLGSTGLSNYTGANRYMDALTAYRTEQLGLKGMTINWGPWDEVGAAAGYISGMFKSFYHFSPEIGIMSLERAMHLGVTQTCIADMDPNLNETMPKLRNLLSEFTISKSNRSRSGENTGGVKEDPSIDGRLDTLVGKVYDAGNEAERLSAIQIIVEAIFRIHAGIDEGDTVDINQPLALMGMDSLIGMEMRTRLAKLFKLTIPSNAIQEHNSVKQFSRYIADSLAVLVPITVVESKSNRLEVPKGLDGAGSSSGSVESVERIEEMESLLTAKPKHKSNFFTKKLKKFHLGDRVSKKLGREASK